MLALTLPKRLANLCSAIRATLGQRQIRQRPGLALNAHSGNEWGKIPVLTGECPKHKNKMKRRGSIVTANLQKVSFVHVDTNFEVLPNLSNIYGSRTISINQPLWLKSSKCKSRYIFSILFNMHSLSN